MDGAQQSFASAAENLPGAFYAIATACPDKIVYYQAQLPPEESKKRIWVSENYETVAGKVWRLANYLRSLGIKNGDYVAILSATRPEWLIADFAILSLGAISVAVYPSLTAEETGYILVDSLTSVVFAENNEQLTKLSFLLSKPFSVPAVEDRPAQLVTLNLKKIITFESVNTELPNTRLDEIISDQTILSTPPEEIFSLRKDDLASLVYTSGTTGPPKGVPQTHGNHLANIEQATKTRLFALDGAIFLFLPLAHSFARLMGYLGMVTTASLKFPAVIDRETSTLRPASVLRDLREANVQLFPTVPRILEKMLGGIRQKAASNTLAGFFLHHAVSSTMLLYQRKKGGERAGVGLACLYLLTGPMRRLIKRNLFGTHFMHIVSGGARLPVEVNEFFAALGITIYEGYGLTETCVATNVNRIGKNKIGSVGPVLDGIEIKIAEDGEILFRGPNVTSHYHRRSLATAAQWDEQGWFHTGDLGRLDADRYLYITGRKKEIIVTAGGKKVAPQPIEEQLESSPYIAHALIYGEGRPYCIALVTLEEEFVKNWLLSQGVNISGELHSDPKVQELIQGEINKLNEHLSRFETVKTFRILPEDFTVENGLLTPTFKVKRSLVYGRYQQLIEECYQKAGTQN